MRRWLKILLLFCALSLILIGSIGAYLWYIWSSNLPYIGDLEDYSPPIITEVYSSGGEVIGRFWEEKRIVVPLDDVSDHLVSAFVAAEDARFFEHNGLDFKGIFRAFFKNLKAGRITQGGSTITQQVTRSLLLRNLEKTYRRKAREAILSIQIEKEFSKERILYLYLNQIYLGHGAYGVEAAARTYFGKSAKELTLAESALLAGLPQAPSRYSPLRNFKRAKSRQRYVLDQMVKQGYITKEEADMAFLENMDLKKKDENPFMKAPYFTEHIRRYLEKTYGAEVLYRGGLKVYTTVDLDLQKKARDALERGLRELDKREGYRGPLRRLENQEINLFLSQAAEDLVDDPLRPGSTVEAVVLDVDDQDKTVTVGMGVDQGLLRLEDMKWARKPDPDVHYSAVTLKRPGDVLSPGDVVLVRVLEEREEKEGPGWAVALEQEPEAQGALFAQDVETGRLLAMVGGRDYRKSQFNRAVQAKRQPGSAFKPMIYAAALDYGLTPSSVVLDAPYVAQMEDRDKLWRPENYKRRFQGRTLLREGLIKSKNVITVKLLRKIGVGKAVSYARRLGIESDLSRDLSLALGSSSLSLLELNRAYGVFANSGVLAEPYFIERIVDRQGNTLEENQPQLSRVIPEANAYVITDLLEGVIQEGTGWRVKALRKPAAGKTGTTNDLRDAWFMGYTPQIATGVWVGYDDCSPMGKGETGSRAAGPIWLYFMQEALKGEPVEDFTVPEGVVFVKIDKKEGLLAGPHSKGTVFQAFLEGTEPKEHVPPPRSPRKGEFSQFDMEFGY
ncbi:MAG: penicillin-binding protein 1A [Desulfobacteraceae bacterium]